MSTGFRHSWILIVALPHHTQPARPPYPAQIVSLDLWAAAKDAASKLKTQAGGVLIAAQAAVQSLGVSMEKSRRAGGKGGENPEPGTRKGPEKGSISGWWRGRALNGAGSWILLTADRTFPNQ